MLRQLGYTGVSMDILTLRVFKRTQRNVSIASIEQIVLTENHILIGRWFLCHSSSLVATLLSLNSQGWKKSVTKKYQTVVPAKLSSSLAK